MTAGVLCRLKGCTNLALPGREHCYDHQPFLPYPEWQQKQEKSLQRLRQDTVPLSATVQGQALLEYGTRLLAVLCDMQSYHSGECGSFAGRMERRIEVLSDSIMEALGVGSNKMGREESEAYAVERDKAADPQT